MEEITFLSEGIETGAGHSSKGNQLKWEKDGYWYKADACGYEGMSEVVVSHFLEKSNCGDFVFYEPVHIWYKGRKYRGCKSRNFLNEKEEIITLEHLYRQYTGFSLARELSHYADVKQRISYTVDFVRNVTGLEEFGKYLTMMLEMDAFFLNEDRHTNNIALLYHIDRKEYSLCPYFDMGLSLFSDCREDFPMGKRLEDCRKEITAKPFSRDFDEQLDAANELFGCYLKFNLSSSEIQREIAKVELLYPQEEIERVREVLCFQAGKYRYMVE